MPTVRAILFDLNGTLLDETGHPEAIRSACAVIAEGRPGLDAAQLHSANAEVWRSYWPEVEDRWTLGLLDSKEVGKEAWRRTLRACGFNDESLVQFARTTHHRFQREALRLFPDARELLDMLPPRISLALVTNGASDTQREALRVLGIEQRFAAVIVAGEVHVAKPDARAFGLAIDRLGVRPDQAWHIGDDLNRDVGGAKAAGLTAVWLNRHGLSRKGSDPRPDYEIRSLTEVAHLLPA
jgi:putative hydrolase of the HAD superfamily